MPMISTFRQMRELADALQRSSSREDWLMRPVHTATAIAESFFGQDTVTGESAIDIESMARSAFINVLCAGLWDAIGRPVVTLGHKTAAACASTRLYADAVDLIRPPWPAFMVRLPTPLLTIMDSTMRRPAALLLVVGLPESLSVVEGSPHAVRWWYKLCADLAPEHQLLAQWVNQDPIGKLLGSGIGVSLWGFNLPTSGMVVPLNGEEAAWQRWDQLAVTDSDARVDTLAKYLVLNTCLYCDAPNSSERVSPPPGASLRTRRSKPDDLGSYTQHDLQTGIALNLCEPIRQYVETGQAPPQYRRLVTPHWKRVVHGPGRAHRRLQHIDAYYRQTT